MLNNVEKLYIDNELIVDLKIPESVTKINQYAFSHYDGLESVTFLGNVTAIDKYAFAHCSNLKSVILPESLITIDERAFWYCDNLESIVIPEAVNYIGSRAFEDCKNLKSVVFENKSGWVRNAYYQGELVKTDNFTVEDLSEEEVVARLITETFDYHIPPEYEWHTYLGYIWTNGQLS